MQQPSAQGIASLFRGNPAPLQQRIQQEQQGKPGLPPDLQKLLALNIVTNEKDAVAKQQAMDQLAQMQGPQGQPPTVMQTVQEQARQKMEAQAVQAQRQQAGLQALMQQAGPGPVPEGTQFAEAQPTAQGIDELPVEFEMAGGGIVAFQSRGSVPEAEDKKYETQYDRMNRKNRGEMTEEERQAQAAREARISQIPTGEEPTVTGGERVRGSETERNILNTLAALPGAGVTKATTLGRQSLAGLASLLGMDKSNAPERQPAPQGAPQAAAPQSAVPYSNEGRTGPRPYTPAPKPVSDLRALADQQVRQQAPRPMPAAPVAVPAAPEAAPVPESDADKLVKSRMMLDPNVESTAAMERRRAALGAPDTSVYEQQIAELERRKAQLEGPQDKFGQLMEYLGQIAATPRGLSSFEAGAAGASNLRRVQQARQLEQFDLSKQALAVSQKKLDAVRAFAVEQYNVGENKFNSVYKDQYDAAKEISKDESERRKLAQQNTLKLLELQQQATLDRERMQNQLRVANIGQTGNFNEQARINKITSLKQQARRLEATDPKGAAELMAQANDLEALVGRGGGGAGAAAAADRQELAELKALLKNAEDIASNPMLPKATRNAAVKRMEDINKQIASMTKMGGGATTPPTAGKVVDFNSLPK
jgi:hypothetical protein